MAPTLSVVLPAYNEAPNICEMVEYALDTLPRLVDDFEIMVVDDGSTDGTSHALNGLLLEHHPKLRVIRHHVNRGYGAAIRTGFANSRSQLAFYTDSDRQFDIAELEWFLPLVAEYDVVVGFRVYRYDSVLRCLLSWLYNRLVRALFRVRVRDIDCAFKLFRREVVDKVSIESTDFFVDTELVARARKWNFRIIEKGVRHYPRLAGETTVQRSDIPRTLRTIARMWRRIYFPSNAMLEEAHLLQATLDANAKELIPTGR